MLATPLSNQSPIHFQFPSPYSLSFFLEQQRLNQQVPGSPSLSPLATTTALARVPSGASPAGSRGVTVPEASDNKVYSGSPLLRQILKAGRKRPRDGEACSPSPSPISQSCKRYCKDGPGVPNTVVIVERKSAASRTRTLSQVQVVPDCVSPKTKLKRNSSKQFNNTYPSQDENNCPNIHRRALPNSTAGMKPFELFSGDDIFAHREE